MSFKTIVITKKTIAVIAAIVITAISGTGLFYFARTRTIDAFNEEDIYKHILSEGLPDNEEKHISIRGIISKIAGFDVNEPETVIEEYSPIFEHEDGGSTGEEAGDSQSTDTEDNTDSTQTTTEPELPDKEQIYTASGLELNNATNYDVDINALCAEDLIFKIEDDLPQVLVMHTHTTECYDGDQMSGETERNTDEAYNVIAVGDEICKVLEENGIKTIHDKTYHDYPSYQGSYTRALTTIENNLKENPSIKVVLDIHRDAFIYADGSKLKVECEQNGVSAAQVMLVVGSNSMGLWHENWRENLKFAAKIQNAANIMYPGLMRPINLRTERFNAHTTNGSLILEVGSNGNTLEQAKEGGKYVARAITAVLKAK